MSSRYGIEPFVAGTVLLILATGTIGNVGGFRKANMTDGWKLRRGESLDLVEVAKRSLEPWVNTVFVAFNEVGRSFVGTALSVDLPVVDARNLRELSLLKIEAKTDCFVPPPNQALDEAARLRLDAQRELWLVRPRSTEERREAVAFVRDGRLVLLPSSRLVCDGATTL
jgi:hypothetical protein